MRPAGEVLRRSDYCVTDVSQAVARQLVEAYHYSRGGPNTGVFRHGLFRLADPECCLGVAWWLPPTRTAGESVAGADWRGVLSLTRLVIVPEAPTNAASYLMAASVKLIRRDPRWSHLVTYADTGQGHTGAIYRAANWVEGGARRGDPVYVDPVTGRHVARKAGARSRTHADMLALGYVSTGRTDKLRFTMALR